MTEHKKTFTLEELSKLQGPLDIPMTNDYLFRALLQQNNQVLKALICSLLHLSPKEVKTVTVENPIELGESYDEKDFILDIKALLNGNLITNLEMQVINEHNWPDRSLYYLCRSFDHLNRGDAYSLVKPVVQIGFLNFPLFPMNPEFYATYYLMNEKTHYKYSDKFRLSVVDLTQIKLATEADRAYGIDRWAKFFKCKDWSELVMLAKENSDIHAAVGTVYQLSREEKIRQQCEAREDYYRRELDRQLIEKRREEKRQKLERDTKLLNQLKQEVAQAQQALAQGQQSLARKQHELAQRRQSLVREQHELLQNQKALEENKARLQERESALEEKIRAFEEKAQAFEKKHMH